MKDITIAVANAVRTDCAKSATGSLGALMGNIGEAWNYGLFADYPNAQLPPSGYTSATYITFMREDLEAVRQRAVEEADVLWHFIFWFKKLGTDLEDFVDRLKYVLCNRVFTASGKGSASQFKLMERTAPQFNADRKAYFIRASFISKCRNFIREK